MKTYRLRDSIPTKVAAALNIYSPRLQKLLYYRGLDSEEKVQAFLQPDFELGTHDPFLLKDMEKAVERILAAIKNDEHIVIYSDYDCDGIPGGVVLHDFFKKIQYENFENYIPHRHEEGYGLNLSAIDKVAERKTNVLITVDCGITDIVPVTKANEKGIDVIITDHHLPNGHMPPAYAIVNPKQADDSYPFDMLCGAGVAFKLVQALIQKGDFDLATGWEKWLLDMAGLSTITDMVPLTGENRVLAHYGLLVLRKSRRPGVQQLFRKARAIQSEATEDDVGFTIGPRINAASRMDHPDDAFRLLATDDQIEAGMLADYLNKVNDERKGHVAAIVKEAKRRIRASHAEKKVIVVGDPKWKPSLVGLAAQSVIDEFHQPVFVWGRDGKDVIKGSCRAPEHINLVELMGQIRDVFIDFGGHAGAAGFSVPFDEIHHLEEQLNAAFSNLSVKDLVQETLVDEELTLDDVTWETYNEIAKLAPFGEGNPKPLFMLRDLVPEQVRQFGKTREHLELVFKPKTGAKVSAIAFFKKADSFTKPVVAGEPVSLIAMLEKSTYGGRQSLRLRVEDCI